MGDNPALRDDTHEYKCKIKKNGEHLGVDLHYFCMNSTEMCNRFCRNGVDDTLMTWSFW